GVAFSRFAGILWPAIAEDNYILFPFPITEGYALSLSTAQLLGIGMIALLTATNVLGLEYGKAVQNLFTVAKTGALLALIVLGLGTALVITLYLLANVAYLVALPLEDIQHAPDDRVGTLVLERIFPRVGAKLMASAILISTFGCCNGLILAGARAYYAMAR